MRLATLHVETVKKESTLLISENVALLTRATITWLSPNVVFCFLDSASNCQMDGFASFVQVKLTPSDGRSIQWKLVPSGKQSKVKASLDGAKGKL
jgi:hypothetical protein